MNRAHLLPLAAIMIAVSCVNAQPPSISELQPPVDGGPTEVTSPSDVVVTGNLVAAASAQDAVNAASEALDKSIAKNRAAGSSSDQDSFHDFKWVQFGSGYGIVSKGIAVYKEQPNPTAGLIAQRNAYVVAYTAAKMAMTRGLEGVASEGSTENKEFSKLIADANEGTTTSGVTTTETISQTANGLLKGYVVYSVHEAADPDDAQYRMVSVQIASTPKTLQSVSRVGAIQDVATINDGLRAAMTEISEGLVPPVGGRVIQVKSNGEMALVGFGSAIVAKSTNKALSMRNKIDAQGIADARARDALVGILSGDEAVWSSGVSSSVSQEFSESTQYAVDTERERTSNETIESALETFTSERSNEDIAMSVRKGVLPPGIVRKAWISEDGNWAKTICICYPGSTTRAQQFSERMTSAGLVKERNDSTVAPPTMKDNADDSTSKTSSGRSVDTSVPVLPSGQLDNEDL
ncbi:hypothetical protein [Allorhodopirellula solitaria]|uniref:Curli production assembly/transport component CsgG n=1 Tax=Allorhodopirellula solitaria TaxID=2527987 RepID=A0A5C5YFC2_9BACT|nr:hypothetical protein [Allorhodopirellula solitaria]TWT73990.1 hypothetical protein CA85_08730 [Allorhodopirellula solitaria]